MKLYSESIMKSVFARIENMNNFNKAFVNQGFEVVPGAGLEPARPYERGILNQVQS